MKLPRPSRIKSSIKQLIVLAVFTICLFVLPIYVITLIHSKVNIPMEISENEAYNAVVPYCLNCQNKKFTTLISNHNLCKVFNQFKDINLLVLVFTISEHVKQRNVIRRTWLNLDYENKYGIKHVFLLGNSYNASIFSALKKENEIYGDLLQKDFVENYYNLTLKTLMGLRYAQEWCPMAKFVFKTDDDVYVNIPALMKTIYTNSRLLFSSVGGHCEVNASVDTNNNSKYYIPKEQYNLKTFPGFCSGTGYVTSMYVVQNILNVVHNISFLQLEDVYVGLCLHKLNFTFSDLEGFRQTFPTPSIWQKIQKYLYLGYNENCFGKRKNVIVIHKVSTKRMEDIWNSDCL